LQVASGEWRVGLFGPDSSKLDKMGGETSFSIACFALAQYFPVSMHLVAHCHTIQLLTPRCCESRLAHESGPPPPIYSARAHDTACTTCPAAVLDVFRSSNRDRASIPSHSNSIPIHLNPSQSTPLHPNTSQSIPLHPFSYIDPFSSKHPCPLFWSSDPRILHLIPTVPPPFTLLRPQLQEQPKTRRSLYSVAPVYTTAHPAQA
jgi:hypothetical protein